MKKIFTLLAVFAITMTAMAQNTVSMKVTGRDNNVLSFQMKNNFEVYGIGFKFKLPEGVTVKTKLNDDDEEVAQIKKSSTRAKGADYKLYINETPDGGYSINMSNTKAPFTGEDGEVLYVELAGTLKGQVKVYDINFCDNTKPAPISYYVDGNDKYEIFVDLIETAINGISADETKSGVIYNMAGQRVSKAVKGVYVVDGKKVAVK